MSTVSRIRANLGQLTVVFTLFIAALESPARAESAATPPHSGAQLEQLVAPIALYPDSLLAQVLMASTYPLEVVQAARWVRENSNVTGKALEDAMQNQQWDPSVKALTSVPQTLQMMNDKLDWTQQLGDAFLAQQEDVLDAVQRLRARADAAGHLQTTEQQKVTRTPRSSSGGPATTSGQATPGGQAAAALPPLIYSIETANPEVYYVPIYDPGAVYGTWPYPDYQPFYWSPPGYVASNVFSFAAGAFVGAAVWGNIDWRRRRTDINVANFNRFNRTNITDNTWVHNPAHRHGAPYRDSGVAARFADQGRTAARENFRGKAEAGQRDLAKRAAQGDLGKRGGQGDLAKRAGQSDLGKRGGQGELGKGGGQSDLGKRGPDTKGKTAGQNTKAKQTAAKQQGQAKNAQRSQQQARNTQKSRQAQNVKRSQPQPRNVQRARQAPAPQARAQQHARPSGGGGRGGGMGGGRGGGRGRR